MVLFVISYKIVVKDGWLERTRARNQNIVKSVLFLDFEVIEGSRGCSKKMQCALRL